MGVDVDEDWLDNLRNIFEIDFRVEEGLEDDLDRAIGVYKVEDEDLDGDWDNRHVANGLEDLSKLDIGQVELGSKIGVLDQG